MKKLITILALMLCSSEAILAAYGFNGHQQTTVLQDNSAKNMLQNQSTGTASSVITGGSIAQTYVNFEFDTSGKNIYLVYTTNGSEPSQFNGTSVAGTFHNYTNPDRTWRVDIPGQTQSTNVKYVFYISDGTLPAAWGIVDSAGYSLLGGPVPAEEGDSADYVASRILGLGFSYTVAAALPVELTTFRAEVIKESVQLAWKTASETNNDGFYVQCSTNGKDWKDMDFVKGAGTTTLEKSYQFVANDLSVGTHYFRLKQKDHNGSVKYSETVSVTIEVADNFLLNPAYPNPFNPAAKIEFAVPFSQDVRLEMYDISGRNVQTLFAGNATANTLLTAAINGEALPSGAYFIRFVGQNFATTQKVMLVK